MCDIVLQHHLSNFLKQRDRLTLHDLVQRALGTLEELFAHGKILLHPDRRFSDQFRRAHPVERWSDDLVKNMLVLTQGAVLVGQLSEPVVIAIQTLLENRQHQDAPKLHARTSGILARTGIDLSLEQCKHFGSNRWTHINMLQTAQQCRNVVARFRIDDDVTDKSAAQFNLCGFDFSHGICLKSLPKWSFSGVFDVFGPISALIWKFFSPGNPPYIIVYIY